MDMRDVPVGRELSEGQGASEADGEAEFVAGKFTKTIFLSIEQIAEAAFAAVAKVG